MVAKEELDDFIAKLPDDIKSELSLLPEKTGYTFELICDNLYKFYSDIHKDVVDDTERINAAIEDVRKATKDVYASSDLIPIHRNDVDPIDISTIGIPETNIIMKFYNYVRGTTDTYPEYIIQSAFSMLATVVQRRMYASLNGIRIYPNLWQGNTGPSGYSRKSAAISKCKRVVTRACGNLFLRDDLNPASLIDALATEILNKKTNKDGDVSWVPEKLMTCDTDNTIRRSQRTFIKDEFGQLLSQLDKPTHSHFKDTFLIIHSCNDYEKELISKYIRIQEPYMSMYWSTTVSTLKKYVTKSDIGSGWLARTLYTEPSYIKNRNPLVDEDDEDPEITKVREVVEKDLAKINLTLRNTATIMSLTTCEMEIVPIRVRFQEGVLQLLEDWVAEREKYYAEKHDELMGAYIARFQENITRLSMLIELGNLPEVTKDHAMCRITDFKISQASMESALKLADVMYVPYAIKLADELQEDNSGSAQSGVSNAIVRVEKQLAAHLKIDWRTCHRNCSMNKAPFEDCIASLESIGAVEKVKVLTKQNKLQTWLVYVPAEMRLEKFKNSYVNVNVSQYKTGINFESYAPKQSEQDKIKNNVFDFAESESSPDDLEW
jgi:hypothetical protein